MQQPQNNAQDGIEIKAKDVLLSNPFIPQQGQDLVGDRKSIKEKYTCTQLRTHHLEYASYQSLEFTVMTWNANGRLLTNVPQQPKQQQDHHQPELNHQEPVKKFPFFTETSDVFVLGVQELDSTVESMMGVETDEKERSICKAIETELQQMGGKTYLRIDRKSVV